MRVRRELLGHGLEFAGLVIVSIAVLWQSAFSDWWKDQLGEWQFQIQEEVNFRLLYSVGDLASLVREEDLEQRRKLAQKINDATSGTVREAIAERDKRAEQMKTGQASLFLRIYSWLAMAGAILFAVGKWFTFKAVLG